MTLKIHGTDNIQPNTISESSILAGLAGAGSTVITSVYITDSFYNNTGATAVDTTGGYIKLLGINFYPGSTLIIGSISAISLTYVSSTELRAQLPAQSASGEYTLYLTNPNGSLYIKPAGVTYSSGVDWVTASTLASQPLGATSTSIQLVATGDAPVTYALEANSTLPAGLTLSSSGLLSGIPPAVINNTNFTFTVVATDVDLQTATRTFTLPVATNALDGRMLLVGGGGGGGGGTFNDGGGGGGAGGFIDIEKFIRLSISYQFTVGTGGQAPTTFTPGGNNGTLGGTWSGDNTSGQSTVFAANVATETLTAIGGGRGATTNGPNLYNYTNGGSGGGYGSSGSGTGLQPTSASAGYGNNGSKKAGGGAGEAADVDGISYGGDGLTSDITGTTTYYAGGGGGHHSTNVYGSPGQGGLGGGGSGTYFSGDNTYGGTDGTDGTGGGGGGGIWPYTHQTSFGQRNGSRNGGRGGNGILVLKIPNTYTATFSAGTTFSTNTSVAGYNIYSVTAAVAQTVTFS